MSRSGYIEDSPKVQREFYLMICQMGALSRTMKGKRTQAFLKELLDALESMQEKRLIADELEADGQYCTLGALGNAKNIDMSTLEADNPEELAQAFNISKTLAREIVYWNDQEGDWDETPEQRWVRMHKWVKDQIKSGT